MQSLTTCTFYKKLGAAQPFLWMHDPNAPLIDLEWCILGLRRVGRLLTARSLLQHVQRLFSEQTCTVDNNPDLIGDNAQLCHHKGSSAWEGPSVLRRKSLRMWVCGKWIWFKSGLHSVQPKPLKRPMCLSGFFSRRSDSSEVFLIPLVMLLKPIKTRSV